MWTQAKVIARVREVAEEKAGVELVTGGMEVVRVWAEAGEIALARVVGRAREFAQAWAEVWELAEALEWALGFP